MTKTSPDIERILYLFERMIDTRYMMLKELDFENHRYAHEYKRKNYEPVVAEIKTLLEDYLEINKN